MLHDCIFHYENIPMLYIAVKKLNIFIRFFYTLLILAQSIDRGYTLEPPRPSGSKEFPQSLF